MRILEANNKLAALEQQITNGQWGEAPSWQGADVVILEKSPSPSRGGFYPDPRYVETEFVVELSWLFLKCRDIFLKLEGYGGWKEELFGRLGNMANRAKEKISPLNCQTLLLAVLHECFSITDEMENHNNNENENQNDNDNIDNDDDSSSDSSDPEVLELDDE